MNRNEVYFTNILDFKKNLSFFRCKNRYLNFHQSNSIEPSGTIFGPTIGLPGDLGQDASPLNASVFLPKTGIMSSVTCIEIDG